MKKHNFSAGPSILPKEVFEEASKAVINLNNKNLSVLEISHRSNDFISIMDEACSLALELTDLKNNGYKAVFLQGGASLQFLMVAYNFLKTKAGYINTGTWSEKAIKEAKLFGEVIEIASSKDKNFNYIPKEIKIDNNFDYVHLTTNNTIFGTQFHNFPDTNSSLISDMSSDIFSRTIDYSKFDLFYAGAQKNTGPAGTTLVILKESLLSEINKNVPSMLSYKIHADKESMFNTPPVFPIYTAMLNLRWIKKNGGIKNIENQNREKANLIYNEIDNNSKFIGFAEKDDRSFMNVTFNLTNSEEKDIFDKICEENNIVGINGHRSVGGYRASIYNAMAIESVEVLVDCMKKFEKL
ncbi:MAG: 3-phosphoserine/phosphohydroxythreonine transaminase [Flavobacteriaceae bacterium]|nr:3-phosphoserine/phosphohydroxythreonine transaminase [Flavobacteriaceae bacterium]|tara:strand:+ start:13913 stop:14974 length:1062 start_codon:yes stop_codon:yes gene_type:complete